MAAAHGSPIVIDVDGHQIRLTSPDKPFFPGATKREVAAYYAAVGPTMMEHLGHRPTALERWPDGVFPAAESFYQKHAPAKGLPTWVDVDSVRFPSGRRASMITPGSSAVLVWAAQMSTVTFHPWPSTAPSTDRPDQLRLDFDPSPGTSFADAVRAALLARELLGEWGWPSFCKTSGHRGVHVYVPIEPAETFIDLRHGAIAIGRELERRAPELITMSWWKEGRGAKVFIDYNQNAQDRLMAAAYSLRATPSATVSMPVAWDVLAACDPQDFTLQSVPGMVAGAGWADPWRGMAAAAVPLARALEQWVADEADGLGELPYPPDFPKMPGEPPRVQPSRARRSTSTEAE